MTMQQKETIHLTFGALPLHISTHFFNQQSSHFQFSQSSDEERGAGTDDLLLDADVDFQEGIGSRRGQSTFFPREIVWAFKGDLGTQWGAYNVLYDDENELEGPPSSDYNDSDEVLRPDSAPSEGLHAWSRPAELLRTHGRVRRTHFEDEEMDTGDTLDSEDEGDAPSCGQTNNPISTSGNLSSEPAQRPQLSARRRPQSSRPCLPPHAYALNPHHPRSTVILPSMSSTAGALAPMGADRTETRNTLDSFEAGCSLAGEIDRESAVFDESIRFFAESSDLLQTFNLTSSLSDGFSGLAHTTLEALQDEYPKTPIVAWGAQWGEDDFEADLDPDRVRLSRLRKTNQVLSLWSLSSANLFVPLQLPHSFLRQRRSGPFPFSKRADWFDPRNAAGLFAAHIDTATLLSRLRSGREPTSTMISRLNWRRDTPIAALSGCLPTPALAPVKRESKMDPVEALLASRGYASKPSNRGSAQLSPRDIAERGAQQIRQHNVSFSLEGKPGKTSLVADFANHAIARDVDKLAEAPTREALEAYLSNGQDIDEPLTRAAFVPLTYNVRSAAFPQIFGKNLTNRGRMISSSQEGARRRRIEDVPVTTTLRTTPCTSDTIRSAKVFVDQTLIRGHAPLSAYGIGGMRGSAAGQAASEESEGLLGGRDGLMEIREKLEELLGAYEEESGVGPPEEDDMGTDEDYVQQEDDDDIWDL